MRTLAWATAIVLISMGLLGCDEGNVISPVSVVDGEDGSEEGDESGDEEGDEEATGADGGESSDEGGESSKDEGGESSEEGGESSEEGGESSEEGGESSEEGGETSEEGGESSEEGGETSEEGGETSDEGGETSEEGGEGTVSMEDCGNGEDDDFDTLVDCEDPDCIGAEGCDGGGSQGGGQGGECDGYCFEQAPSECWCDELCAGYGDCCEGVCDSCSELSFCDEAEEGGEEEGGEEEGGEEEGGEEEGGEEEGGEEGGDGPPTCDGACGGQSPRGCYCDEACAEYGDCCEDACTYCELSFCEGEEGPADEGGEEGPADEGGEGSSMLWTQCLEEGPCAFTFQMCQDDPVCQMVLITCAPSCDTKACGVECASGLMEFGDISSYLSVLDCAEAAGCIAP